MPLISLDDDAKRELVPSILNRVNNAKMGNTIQNYHYGHLSYVNN